MRCTTTIIIGAGQAGLAMSRHLTELSVEHVILERGQVANSWRKERWDSLRLLTPNWQSRLPGFAYSGSDPDGYRTMPETIDFLSDYASSFNAPIETETTVLSVRTQNDGYTVETDQGDWTCKSVVLASGACNIANVPRAAEMMPQDTHSITPMEYRNPDALEDGGVLIVGGSATGVQFAHEIKRAGREVFLATGEHVRVPRTYRGKDIMAWMDAVGAFDLDLNEVDDITRARHVPSMQLIGTPAHETISLNSLQAEGVTIAGRLMGFSGNNAQFSGSLANVCSLADLKMNRLLQSIDEWIDGCGMGAEVEASYRLRPTEVPETPLVSLDLRDAGIKTVIWATGYRADYSWLDRSLADQVLDRKGRIIHQGGVLGLPGLYAMGLPFMRKRKSTLIDGAGDDARDLSQHLMAFLNNEHSKAA